MSRFWPQADYAEDQRFGRAILNKHVIDRGFQTGGILGLAVGETLAVLQYRRYQASKRAIGTGAAAAAATAATASSNNKPMLLRTIVNASGIGALTGASLLAVIMPFYMRGKTDIEWQDRSWRLLNNKGQVEVDDWTLIGEVAGVSTFLSTTVNKLVGPRLASAGGPSAANTAASSKLLTGKYAPLVVNVVGRASIGGTIGLLGYMIWRYGIRQGKRSEDVSGSLSASKVVDAADGSTTGSTRWKAGLEEKAVV